MMEYLDSLNMKSWRKGHSSVYILKEIKDSNY